MRYSFPPQGLLPIDLEDQFVVGHEETDRQFGLISGMTISPRGHVLALDALGRTVTVWDASGIEVHHWGRQGDGPGELQAPTSISVSHDLTVAIVDRNRVSLYELNGDLIETHGLAANGAFADFTESGQVVVLTMDVLSMELVLTRLGDGSMLWNDAIPESVLSPFFGARLVFARLPSGDRAVLGASAAYQLPVIDLTNGEPAGNLAREVSVRRVPNDFESRLKRYLANPSSAPDGWASLLGNRDQAMPS